MSDDAPRNALDVEKPPLEDRRLYAVTTVIKATSSNEALIYWAAEETAKAAVNTYRTLGVMIEEKGPDNAIDWLKGARFDRPKGERGSMELGSVVHEVLEEYAKSGVRPEVDDEIRPYLEQFDRWAQQFQPEYEGAEMTVYHPDYGYAGTLDGIMVVGGVRFIFDYKTSKKSKDKKANPTSPYPEVGLQLAAYRFASFAAAWRVRQWENFKRRYYLLGADELDMAVEIPKVDAGLAIHITPEHCNAHPVQCDEDVFTQFLYKIEDSRFEFEMARGIISDPLVPPAKEPEQEKR